MAAELADGPLRYSAVVPRLVLPVCIFCLTHFSAATCLPLQLFFLFCFLAHASAATTARLLCFQTL